MSRLSAIDPALARAKGEFKFVTERDKDVITDLPNPLPRRAIH
jgi:hypothetical protein